MKHLLAIILMLPVFPLKAQEPEQQAVRQAIISFFDGFHHRDSLALKKSVSEGVILQTIARDKEGAPFVKTEDFSQFLKSIVSIPDSVSFREEIKSYLIRIDGSMANAWTPYEFWYRKAFSHCGVNSFQLFNDGMGWKIIYLIDTRRKEGCE